MRAIEFGEQHGSCEDAMNWRRSLGPNATQADAWKACRRGDWLLWQLGYGITVAQYTTVHPLLERAITRIVERAILMAHHAAVAADAEDPAWEMWAFAWVTGEDRTSTAASKVTGANYGTHYAALAARCLAAGHFVDAVNYAADAAAGPDAEDDELYQQVEDIRAEIPVWPGKE